MHWRFALCDQAEEKAGIPARSGTIAAIPAYRRRPTAGSNFMKIAGTILAAIAALGIAGTTALAQQMRTGMVTRIDRISGTITIKDMPDGTTGANDGAATEDFKVQDGARLNALHAGDRVTFALSDAAGTKTITKIDRAEAVTKIDKK
jgi:Cu/Ag efflux protein CusF